MTTRRVRACLARLAAAVVAVVMLVGVLRGGSRYVYCPAMQMVSDRPCCPGDVHRQRDAEVAIELRSRDCCEQHVIGKLPAVGTTASTPPLFDAPLVATLPVPAVDKSTRAAASAARFERECRAGPVALARHRAELMVALN